MSSPILVREQNIHSPTIRCLCSHGNASKDMWSPGLLLRTGCYSWPQSHKVRSAQINTQMIYWKWYLSFSNFIPVVTDQWSATPPSFSCRSALLQVPRCVQTEAPAFRWLAGQTDGGPEGSVHIVQPCTQLVHRCDLALWAEPHWCPAALCQSPVS